MLGTEDETEGIVAISKAGENKRKAAIKKSHWGSGNDGQLPKKEREFAVYNQCAKNVHVRIRDT